MANTGPADFSKGEGGTFLAAKWAGRTTFTVEETADILQISRWAAYEAVKGKEIGSVRIGRVIRIPRHCLERKLAGLEETAA
jgi:excisionase family DNA binding protein